MSCIYGPHQIDNEDQGWVAHFLMRALEGQTITLYDDGKQVRDVLYVDDLVGAFLLARAEMPRIADQAFNIGGGPDQVISLLELMDMIGHLNGHQPEYEFQDLRPGDQRYYGSDTRKFRNATGWWQGSSPRWNKKLYRWLRESQPKTYVKQPPGSSVARSIHLSYICIVS